MILNSVEIDAAVRSTDDTEIYHAAALYLRRFRDLIDSISDGWHSWGYGTRCSEPLQQLVQEGMWLGRRRAAAETKPAYRAAQRKIITFLKRCQQTKDRPEVKAFITRERS